MFPLYVSAYLYEKRRVAGNEIYSSLNERLLSMLNVTILLKTESWFEERPARNVTIGSRIMHGRREEN